MPAEVIITPLHYLLRRTTRFTATNGNWVPPSVTTVIVARHLAFEIFCFGSIQPSLGRAYVNISEKYSYSCLLHSTEERRKPRVFGAQCEAPGTVRANLGGDKKKLHHDRLPLSDSGDDILDRFAFHREKIILKGKLNCP